MPKRPSDVRKQFPKSQGILDGIFDPDELQGIKDAQDDLLFEPAGLDTIKVDYRCPDCGFGWSGNPKPSDPKEKKS